MSTTSPISVLFGKTQRALLSIFFACPEQSFYFRQIVRMAGVGQGAVQRELRCWVEAELLTRTRKGNQVHYQANRTLPIFNELRAISVKTGGVADVLREALDPLANKIVLAFIHGSLASGRERAGSDVDLVVVGDVSFSDVVAALQEAQDRVGREVNPSVYSTEEFRKKIRSKHQFLTSATTGAKIFIIGGQHELERLGA